MANLKEKDKRINRITFIAKDNSSVDVCLGETLKRSDSIKKNKNGEYEFIGKTQKTQIYSKDSKELKQFLKEVLEYYLENVITPEVIKNEVLSGTKWDQKETEDLIFDHERDVFGNFVGVISKSFEMEKEDFSNLDIGPKSFVFDVTLQIFSRFDTPDKPYFLSNLLTYGYNLRLTDNESPVNKDNYFDFLLISFFCQRMKKALRKGLYKSYFKFEGDDDKLKGAIDVQRHLRLNMGQDNGKIAYAYRERSIVNYLNVLILKAYYKLKKKYYYIVTSIFERDLQLKNSLEILKCEIDPYSFDDRSVIKKNLRPISHPYFLEYDQVRDICLRILKNDSLSYGDNNESAKGIIYYMPDLWEEYLLSLLKTSADYEVKCQKELSIFNYSGKPEFVQTIRPDYVFQKNDHPFMVLDAKFKPLWDIRVFNEDKLGKFGNDSGSLMGDYDKCIRDMNAFNVHATGVIFPSSNNWSEYEDKVRHEISVYNKNDCFFTFPIYVPKIEQSTRYADWYGEFRDTNKKIRNKIKQIIINECFREKQQS